MVTRLQAEELILTLDTDKLMVLLQEAYSEGEQDGYEEGYYIGFHNSVVGTLDTTLPL